jgi:4-amino-4-deoxy-L-arabinose transferase-like glycosyltransferase
VTRARAQEPAATAAVPAASSNERRFWLVLAMIVLAGVLIRVLYTLLEAPTPAPTLNDEFYFAALPKLIADGHGWIAPVDFVFKGISRPTAEHPPFYTAVLTGLAWLGGRSVEAQALTGSFFGAGTIATLGALGRRLAGARAGLLAAGLAALYPTLIAADGALMSESLFGLLVALSMLAAYRLADTPTVGRAVALGAVAGLAALTRGEALLLLLLFLVPVLRRPGGWRAAAAAVASLVVVLAPWTVRNWIEFDQPVLIATNGGSAIGGANCEQTYYGSHLGGWTLDCVTKHPGNEADALGEAGEDGIRYARDHVGRLPVVLAARLGGVWSLYHPFQIPEGRSGRVQKLGVVAFFVLLPFAVAGALLLRRRGVAIWILLMPAVAASITALATYGNLRFRESAELSLVVLAAVALDALWASRSTRPATAA